MLGTCYNNKLNFFCLKNNDYYVLCGSKYLLALIDKELIRIFHNSHTIIKQVHCPGTTLAVQIRMMHTYTPIHEIVLYFEHTYDAYVIACYKLIICIIS